MSALTRESRATASRRLPAASARQASEEPRGVNRRGPRLPAPALPGPDVTERRWGPGLRSPRAATRAPRLRPRPRAEPPGPRHPACDPSVHGGLLGPGNVNTPSEQDRVLGIVMYSRHVAQPAVPGGRADGLALAPPMAQRTASPLEPENGVVSALILKNGSVSPTSGILK